MGDDTLLLCEPGERVLLSFRYILLSFKAVSRLNINLAKLGLGEGRDADRLARIIRCRCMELPIKYLGFLLGVNYKDVTIWDSMVTKYEKKLASWKKHFLLKGGGLR